MTKTNQMKIYTLVILIFFLYSCSTNNKEKNADAVKRQYTEQQNPVTVMVLQKGLFRKEMVNNGKLVAVRKSELQFRVSEQLEKMDVKNGDHLKVGQLIAELNSFTYKQQLVNAQIQLKKARLEMQNVLIGQGYNTMDSTQIPPNIYDMALVRSGYAEALQSMKTAQFNLESTRLIAPFPGVLANIESKMFEQVGSGTAFCTLIDDSAFEVEFKVVENEIADIQLNDEVKLIPFSYSDKDYSGRISEINPIIDENGLILVKAKLTNPGGLMEGMNVKVLVEKEIPEQMIVPKSAVLLRDNQEVLFKYTKGIAFWTYIQTLAENSTSYSVIAHPDKGATLEPGDTVIVSGNLNLAHESKVVIK